MWEHGNVVDLLVYEPGQKANICIFDKDPGLGNSFKGLAKRCKRPKAWA